MDIERLEHTLHPQRRCSLVRSLFLSLPHPLHSQHTHRPSSCALNRPDDLLLLDAGATKGHYITDITRTFPVSGTFSPAHRDLYSAVLEVQRKCVDLCRENANISLHKLHEVAEKGLREGLSGLGFDVRGKVRWLVSLPFRPKTVGYHRGLLSVYFRALILVAIDFLSIDFPLSDTSLPTLTSCKLPSLNPRSNNFLNRPSRSPPNPKQSYATHIHTNLSPSPPLPSPLLTIS